MSDGDLHIAGFKTSSLFDRPTTPVKGLMGPPAVRNADNKSSAPIFDDDMSKPPACPKTPSHIPVSVRKNEASTDAIPIPDTPTLRASVSKRSASPTKSQYLTKDSNVTSFVAWDVDMEARLKKYDDMFADMKETMAATANEDQSLKDQINHYKLRCKLGNYCRLVRRLTVYSIGGRDEDRIFGD